MRYPLIVLTMMALGASPMAAPAWAAEKLKLRQCDGGKRRDANPYGSVLPGSPKPAVTMPPEAASRSRRSLVRRGEGGACLSSPIRVVERRDG